MWQKWQSLHVEWSSRFLLNSPRFLVVRFLYPTFLGGLKRSTITGSDTRTYFHYLYYIISQKCFVERHASQSHKFLACSLLTFLPNRIFVLVDAFLCPSQVLFQVFFNKSSRSRFLKVASFASWVPLKFVNFSLCQKCKEIKKIHKTNDC